MLRKFKMLCFSCVVITGGQCVEDWLEDKLLPPSSVVAQYKKTFGDVQSV